MNKFSVEKFDRTQFDIGGIIRTIRKHSGLSQVEMSNRLNVNQPTFSKIERGLISTSTENWLTFAYCMQLNFDAPLSGVIDFGIPNDFNSLPNSFSGIYFPSRFQEERTLSTRLLFPLLDYIKLSGYGKAMLDFYKKNKVDPDYLKIMHHSTNLVFVTELLDTLTPLGFKFNPENFIRSPRTRYLFEERGLRSCAKGRNLLKNSYLECLFNYQLDEINNKKRQFKISLSRTVDRKNAAALSLVLDVVEALLKEYIDMIPGASSVARFQRDKSGISIELVAQS